MADGKLQQIRRSISSWSLSTVKKPKITIPKLKAPKIKAFRGKKNRVDQKDEAAALEEVKAALLKAEGDGKEQGGDGAAVPEGETSSEVIHEPVLADGTQDQPIIVLTVHEHKNPSESPSPPPSPGLLAVNDDLEFIDSDNDEADPDDKITEAIRPDLDYSDQWFDAKGTLTRSKENVVLVEAVNDIDDGQESKYYDFVETINTDPMQDEVPSSSKDKAVTGGSQKAREWVKSFDESRIHKWFKIDKFKTSSNLPKSQSEVRLDNIDDSPDKWSKRDEIKLNTLSKEEPNTLLMHCPEGKGLKKQTEKGKFPTKEGFKKIFQKKGKVSIKTAVDTRTNTYTNDANIHLATTPFVLVGAAGTSEELQPLEVCVDGINTIVDDDIDTSNKVIPAISSSEQNNDTSNPVSHSLPVKQEVLTVKNDKVVMVPDVTNNSQCLNEQKLLNDVGDKQPDENNESSLPKPLEVSPQGSLANKVLNSPENPRNQMESLKDDSKTSCSLSQDSQRESMDTNINHILTKHEIYSADQDERQTVEHAFISSVQDRETEGNIELLKNANAADTKSSKSFKEKINMSGESTIEKVPHKIQERKEVFEAIETPSINAKEMKKTNISGTSFPKSIKNFAESVFSPQTPNKSKKDIKEEQAFEKKKKKPRIAHFNREMFFKTSVKDKSEPVKNYNGMPQDTKSIQNGEKSEVEPSISKNLNPFEDDDGNPLSDETPDLLECNNDSVVNKRDSGVITDDSTPCLTTQDISNVLHTNGVSSVSRNSLSSSVSLEFVSQVDSDEMKSVSHERTPELDSSFVEEDGLILRKDALKAIKSMKIDDTATHYYSLNSTLEEFQTPLREDEDLQPIASTKVISEANFKHDVQKVHEKKIYTQILQRQKEKTPEKKKDNESPTQELHRRKEKTPEKKIEKSPVREMLRGKERSPEKRDENSSTQELQSMKERTSEKKQESLHHFSEPLLSNSNSQNTNKTDDEKQVRHTNKVEELNLKNNEERVSHDMINSSSTVISDATLNHDHSRNVQAADISEGVPKLKLETAIEKRDGPKPSPRTKKGRYGYSTVGKSDSPKSTSFCKDQSVSDFSENIKVSSTKVTDNTIMATYPRRNIKKDPSRKSGHERNSSDSGYAGPISNYYGGSDPEPIYWEIGDPVEAPPIPSPRNKKNPKGSGDVTPTKILVSPNKAAPSSPQTNDPHKSQNKPLPEWINTRAPIPSPRGKKQRSLQSLPTVVPPEPNFETVKKKLQLMSNESLQDITIPTSAPNRMRKEEDQFYSGKAASISYGFTSSQAAPPSPPSRPRKVSQISLPAAMAAEQTQSKQVNRRSLFVTPDGREAPEPPSPRRTRRRKDVVEVTTIRYIESAVKRMGEKVICLTELLSGSGLKEEATEQKTEELLTDVLYSVHSLMGGNTGGIWKVGGEGDIRGPFTRSEVNVEQVVEVLQSAFQVTQDTIDRLRAEVKSKPPPEVHLHISIKEATDLRPKTVKGTTNPYVIVSVSSSGASHRTRLEKDTLRPKWNQDFTLPIENLQKETLQLEVWHEHDAVKMKQALTAMRDIKGMSRLVKGTTAQVQHQPSHLLGCFKINVKDLIERESDGWFSLEKNEERSKERGKIHLVGSVTSKAQLVNKNRQSYDALLARLVHHQLTLTNNNNDEQHEWLRPWEGHISGPGAASLAQYAIMLDLSDAALQLSWWKVGSRVPTADGVWILSRLQQVQAFISKNLYQDEELLELRSSFCSFIQDQTDRLKNLHKTFPPSSGIIARRQLTYTLKALQCMQNHAGTRALLDLEDLPPLQEMVTSSLAIDAKNWWTRVIEELRGVRTTDEQISHVINIVKESHTFLSIAANTYNAIFMKEMNIPYMQNTYLMVSNKVNPCVRPLVINIYNQIPVLNEQGDGEEAESEYQLEVGTSLWELYMNLGRLYQLSEHLPAEAQAESGVREYHRWFSRGVLRWLELALHRAQSMIKRAVELDMLEPQDNYCKFSSSASDTLGIFNDVKIWWQKLAWPDPENSAVLLTKILEDICSCVLSYSNLIQQKVEHIFHQYENSTRVFITEQICVGLNNIERVRTEMVKLSTQFGFHELLERIRASSGGDSAAAQLEATVERLIVNAAENMEGKVNEFIDTMLDKMKPTLERAVQEACEEHSSALAQVLDPSLELTMNQLNATNFKLFLWRVWEVVVEIFTTTVMRNTERRKANYFGGVHSVLEATLSFFSPPEGKGLDQKTAMTPAYTSLMELLESLRMSSESLIGKYYQERYEEQMEEILPSKAKLYVKMLFTKVGKLIVEVIMAKEMVVEGDAMSISSRSGLGIHTSHQPVDSYVKVQLVPQEWFPAMPIRKTKTQRKQDPAVYEETFEFDVNKNDDGVCAGFLLLTLKDYNLGFTNTFIGEAAIPLSTLPCVDSSQVHTVPNTCLTMTSPGLDIGYKSLRALQFRTGDKVASNFVKKVSKRLLEPKAKPNTGIRSIDDKGTSKSPNMRERLKLS